MTIAPSFWLPRALNGMQWPGGSVIATRYNCRIGAGSPVANSAAGATLADSGASGRTSADSQAAGVPSAQSPSGVAEGVEASVLNMASDRVGAAPMNPANRAIANTTGMIVRYM